MCVAALLRYFFEMDVFGVQHVVLEEGMDGIMRVTIMVL